MRSLLRRFLDDGGGPTHVRTPPFQRAKVLGADKVLATENPLPAAGTSDGQGSLGHQRSGFVCAYKSRVAISIETEIIPIAENNPPSTRAYLPRPSYFARKHSSPLHVSRASGTCPKRLSSRLSHPLTTNNVYPRPGQRLPAPRNRTCYLNPRPRPPTQRLHYRAQRESKCFVNVAGKQWR